MASLRVSDARRSCAFTLIELLVVIAIIALLIAILLPALGHARRNGRVAVTLARLRDMAQGATLYADASRGHFPVLIGPEDKSFLGLSLLAKEHEVPVEAFLNPNVREDTRAESRATDERPILADLAGAEITSATPIDPSNIGAVRWHCSFSYDNDPKRGDDGRPRAFLGDRADYALGQTRSANWNGQGQCVVWTDQHGAFLKTRSIREQSDPNLYHHNEFGGEGGTEVRDGIAVTRATLDTHLRFFSELEDDVLLPN